MTHPVGLLAISFDSHGAELSRSAIGLASANESVGRACLAAGPQAGLIESFRVYWRLSDGPDMLWFDARALNPSRLAQIGASLSDIHAKGGDFGVDALLSGAARPIFEGDYETISASLKLSPDYGGATFWEPFGACCDLAESSALPGRRGARSLLDERASVWQAHFETRVDFEDGDLSFDFEWWSFSSKAAALALHSRSVLACPLHVEAAFECPFVEIEGQPSPKNAPRLFLPLWSALSPSEESACQALERLDQDDFCRLIAQGAVQQPQAPMPWAVYCSHMGLPQALAACLRARPEALRTPCSWGCLPWQAALFEADPECLSILLSLGSPGPLDNSERAVGILERLAQSAPVLFGDEPHPGSARVEACLNALANAGVLTSVAASAPERLTHSASQQVLAWAQRADIGRSAHFGAPAKSRKTL